MAHAVRLIARTGRNQRALPTSKAVVLFTLLRRDPCAPK
jgi:hypothetical protein